MIFKYTEIEKIDKDKHYAMLHKSKTKAEEYDTNGVCMGSYALEHQDDRKANITYLTEVTPEVFDSIMWDL